MMSSSDRGQMQMGSRALLDPPEYTRKARKAWGKTMVEEGEEEVKPEEEEASLRVATSR